MSPPAAAGALRENTPDKPPDADAPADLAMFNSAAATAALAMPAFAAEKAIPPKERMPFMTLPPNLAATLPRSACVMLSREELSAPQLDEVAVPLFLPPEGGGDC